MQSKAKSVNEYLKDLPVERFKIISDLRNVILKNLPVGFAEEMSYGMIGYVVPKNIYPNGYHCNPKLPLPFMGLASQKNYISVYHMAMYDKRLIEWFSKSWSKRSNQKLDIGVCCIRIKKFDEIPIDLIGELARKINVKEWISIYESQIKKK